MAKNFGVDMKYNLLQVSNHWICVSIIMMNISFSHLPAETDQGEK